MSSGDDRLLMALAVTATDIWFAHLAPGIALLFRLINAVAIGLMVAAYRPVWPLPFAHLNFNQAAHRMAILDTAFLGLTAMLGRLVLVKVGHDTPFLDQTLQWWSSHTIGAAGGASPHPVQPRRNVSAWLSTCSTRRSACESAAC